MCMETTVAHTEHDFEQWMEEAGFAPEDRFAALEKFAHKFNYTVDELEEAW